MQTRTNACIALFDQWIGTAEAREATRYVRQTIQHSGAVLHRRNAATQRLAKIAAFREMKMYATKKEGLEGCAPGDWFYCQSAQCIYWVSTLLEQTAEKVTLQEAHAKEWRVPDSVGGDSVLSGSGSSSQSSSSSSSSSSSKNAEDTTVETSNSSSAAFSAVECVRSAVRASSLSILNQNGSAVRASSVAKASMKTCNTKLSVLLHNLECCCGNAMLLSVGTWLFSSMNGGASDGNRKSSCNCTDHPHFNILVVKGWYSRKDDIRSEWPAGAVVYECVLPAIGEWDRHGALVVVLTTEDSQHNVDYFCRFLLS